MDASRLIRASRYALGESRGAPEIAGEVWQAQALAEAMGSWLALCGPVRLRTDALALGEAGSRACAALPRSLLRGDEARAAQLRSVADPPAALGGLEELLGEVGTALVAVGCGDKEDPLYWDCMDAVDAADVSRGRAGRLRQGLVAADGVQEQI